MERNFGQETSAVVERSFTFRTWSWRQMIWQVGDASNLCRGSNYGNCCQNNVAIIFAPRRGQTQALCCMAWLESLPFIQPVDHFGPHWNTPIDNKMDWNVLKTLMILLIWNNVSHHFRFNHCVTFILFFFFFFGINTCFTIDIAANISMLMLPARSITSGRLPIYSAVKLIVVFSLQLIQFY